MSGKDDYYNRSKQQGYRARSAYKLKQLDEEADLLGPGDTVVDLGAAPGGWLQVVAEAVGERGADVVLSDMAPNMTGEYSLDHARSIHLARQAFDVAEELLAPGGDFVVKAFQGEDLDAFREDVRAEFEYLRTVSPPASRDSSSEVYLVAKGLNTAPVEAGDRIEVTIEELGDEGDGIAYVEGYSVFVPGAGVGETLTVVVDEAKPRFGFAERVDGDDE